MRYVALLACLLSAPALAQPIVIDGEFDDWENAGVVVALNDPAGDAVGPFDIRRVWITADDDRYLFSFEVGTDAFNLQSGAYAPELGLRFDIDLNGSMISIDTFMHTVFVTPAGGDPTQLSGTSAGLVIMPTFASTRYEMAVPRELIPEFPIVVLRIRGSDTADAAAVLFTTQPNPELTATASRHPDAHLRIASLNTERTGILDAAQRPALSRLVQAARADVYCIQEEYASTGADLAAFFAEADPFGDGAPWNVVKEGDHAVVSRMALAESPLASFGAGAFVDLSPLGRDPVLILSIHPQYGGYVGNHQDAIRIAFAKALAEALQDIADGAIEPTHPGSSIAPVFVVGDWNLVGSRTPLTILETDAGLAAPPLIDLGSGGSAVTWRSIPSSLTMFFPGRLDLMAHNPTRTTRPNAFVLNTQTLSSTQLSELGLLADDSFEASDHLMLVADYAFTPQSPDLNADGVVDSSDLAFLLAFWEQGGPADLTGDGVVDSSDLAVILAAWD